MVHEDQLDSSQSMGIGVASTLRLCLLLARLLLTTVDSRERGLSLLILVAAHLGAVLKAPEPHRRLQQGARLPVTLPSLCALPSAWHTPHPLRHPENILFCKESA